MNTRYLFGTASGLGLARTWAPDEEGGGGGETVPAAGEAPPGAEPPGGDGGEGGSDTVDAGGSETVQAGADTTPAAGEAPPPPKRTPWQQKRIDALTAQARTAEEGRASAERERDEARQRAERYEALYGADTLAAGSGDPPPAVPPAAGGRVYTQAEFQAESARQANIARLSEKCETLFDAGAKVHGVEWTNRVTEAAKNFGAELQRRTDFWEAITKLPNGAEVYHTLAGDLDHLDEVLRMQPVELGMELARLSTSAAAPPRSPPVSRVPAPIDPLQGNGGGTEEALDKMPIGDYVAAREKQRAERRKERGW